MTRFLSPLYILELFSIGQFLLLQTLNLVIEAALSSGKRQQA